MKVNHLECAALVALLIYAAPSAFAEPVWLSSLDLTQMTTGWNVAKVDRDITGKPISIAGKVFEHGVGTHATSRFRVNLGGQASSFEAQVGVDGSAGSEGSVEFIVSGEGRIRWRSGLMTNGQPAINVKVDLAGVKTLLLQVTDGGDGVQNDHADWADAKIIMQDGAPKPVTLPPHEQFGVHTRNFDLNFEVGDDGRLYQPPIWAGGNQKLQRTDESYPQAGDGYVWEPALQITHSDGNTSTALVFEKMTRTNFAPGRELVQIALRDPAYALEVTLNFQADHDRDVVEQWTEIINHETGPVVLERMASSALLFPPTNVYLTHFPGDWTREMLNPATELITRGTKILDTKLGVRAAQYEPPAFILSPDGPPAENRGRVLAGSLEWSGNFQFAFDDNGRNVRALCGVNPFASAYHLDSDKTFTTPKMLWVSSANGLGEMSRKLHRWARDFGLRDGHKTRDVLLNNWEATGFNFDFNRIAGLYAPAKEIGAELFLLDDGWFGNKYPRVNDHAGLGDWQPNRQRMPGGLESLAKEAVSQGLRFGIWIEPEMVNPKSELFEKHPDWVISQPKRELQLERNQLVLDLTRPEVQAFEWQSIKDTLDVPGVTYAKWDCNRYLTQPGSAWLAPGRQSHLWIDYVNALYALMDETAKTFPNTQLMLCSGGGGRADYGALKYFHEFWPSDNTDPVARVPMQWGYSYFFPSMAMAGHVTRGGNRPMHFACAVALSVCFGMDLDVTGLSIQDRSICAGAVAACKKIREVTQLGDLYRLEDPRSTFRGALDFISPDRERAVVFVFQLKNGPAAPVYPQGLDPAKNYSIHELNPAPGRAAMPQEGQTFTGQELMRGGITPSCANAVEASVIGLGY